MKYKALYILHNICVPFLAEITLLQIPILETILITIQNFRNVCSVGFLLHLVRLYGCHFVLLLKGVKNS